MPQKLRNPTKTGGEQRSANLRPPRLQTTERMDKEYSMHAEFEFRNHYYGRSWRYRDYAKYIHPNCGDLKKPPTRGGYEGAFAKSVWLWATIHGLTKTQPDMETPTRVTFSCNACRWGILREPCNYCNWREGHPTTTSERPSTTVSLVQGTTPVNHL